MDEMGDGGGGTLASEGVDDENFMWGFDQDALKVVPIYNNCQP